MYPAVRYHPSGKSCRVEDEAQDRNLAADNWRATPYPPPEPTPIRGDLQSQVTALTERVTALEAQLKQPQKKKAS